MKKKNLKSLKLNKKSISNLDNKTGGQQPANNNIVAAGSWLFPGCDTHPMICQPSDIGCGITENCPLQTKAPCMSEVPNYSCECTIA
jgi:hypothetical protein